MSFLFRNKTAVFGYTSTVNRIGLTHDDPIFGSVKISWRGQEMNNLQISKIEVENLSFKDFENVKFHVYCETETYMLTENTPIVDSPYIAEHSPEFRELVEQISKKEENTDVLNRVYHHREYVLPVFNRGQVARFEYLCTRPSDQENARIYIDCQTKGVRARLRKVFASELHS